MMILILMIMVLPDRFSSERVLGWDVCVSEGSESFCWKVVGECFCAFCAFFFVCGCTVQYLRRRLDLFILL